MNKCNFVNFIVIFVLMIVIFSFSSCSLNNSISSDIYIPEYYSPKVRTYIETSTQEITLTSTIERINNFTLSPTFTITPFTVSTSYDFVNLYFDCINTVRDKTELYFCFNMLSGSAKSDLGPDYIYLKNIWDVRYQYKIYLCPGYTYSVAAKILEFPRPDINFESPNDNSSFIEIKKFKVVFNDGKWSIDEVIDGSLFGCSMKYEDHWYLPE
jgi:hypothetical protein